jgi:prepilin peptidase CpaA
MVGTTVTLVPAVALIVCGVACLTDIRTRRIPNALTLTAAVAALAYHVAITGWSGGLHALAGLGLGLVLFFPFFALGGMGAGDVKLLAALGAWLGPSQVVWVAIYAAIAGGVLAVAVSLARGYAATLFRNIWLLLTHWRVGGIRRFDALTLEHSRGPRLAYAVPIAVGVLCSFWLR